MVKAVFRTEKQIQVITQVIDEMCQCGTYKSLHGGIQGHGGSAITGCKKFSFDFHVYGKAQPAYTCDEYTVVVVEAE